VGAAKAAPTVKLSADKTRRLSDFLVESIAQKLEYSNIQKTRVHEMQQAYNFINRIPL
jgi:hypothetical protein